VLSRDVPKTIHSMHRTRRSSFSRAFLMTTSCVWGSRTHAQFTAKRAETNSG
jgi:hypothetical protein